MELFEHAIKNSPAAPGPLADRLRPQRPDDFEGMGRTGAAWQLVSRALRGEGLGSNLILWGPPGTGKTTLARLLARAAQITPVEINATDAGVKDIKAIGENARLRRSMEGQQTLLFIDEIHRLNKGQQDVLLPFSERGDFVLVGATTENPSYELNSALLSRCQVVRLERLTPDSMKRILDRAATHLGIKVSAVLTPEGIDELFHLCDGDARRLLNLFELVYGLKGSGEAEPLSAARVTELLERQPLGYQKTGDDHYDCISAFIKSIRGSDPDAASYYLARMLDGGEDPVFIARRLVILASEDIGNADPRGLPLAVAGLQAVELVGMPEAAINLAQVTTYLASAPKSNASYEALKLAQAEVEASGREPVPLALRSAKTALMKSMGYGKGYKYSHEGERGFVAQEFLPERLRGKKFYEPKELGFEKTIRQYLNWLRGRNSSE